MISFKGQTCEDPITSIVAMNSAVGQRETTSGRRGSTIQKALNRLFVVPDSASLLSLFRSTSTAGWLVM